MWDRGYAGEPVIGKKLKDQLIKHKESCARGRRKRKKGRKSNERNRN